MGRYWPCRWKDGMTSVKIPCDVLETPLHVITCHCYKQDLGHSRKLLNVVCSSILTSSQSEIFPGSTLRASTQGIIWFCDTPHSCLVSPTSVLHRIQESPEMTKCKSPALLSRLSNNCIVNYEVTIFKWASLLSETQHHPGSATTELPLHMCVGITLALLV